MPTVHACTCLAPGVQWDAAQARVPGASSRCWVPLFTLVKHLLCTGQGPGSGVHPQLSDGPSGLAGRWENQGCFWLSLTLACPLPEVDAGDTGPTAGQGHTVPPLPRPASGSPGTYCPFHLSLLQLLPLKPSTPADLGLCFLPLPRTMSYRQTPTAAPWNPPWQCLPPRGSEWFPCKRASRPR